MYLIRLITPSGSSPASFNSSVTFHTAARNAQTDFSTSVNAAMKYSRSLSSREESLYGCGTGPMSAVFSAIDIVVGVDVNSPYCACVSSSYVVRVGFSPKTHWSHELHV